MIAHDSGTAAHIGNLCVIVPFFIILQIKRCINKTEIREQTLCRYFDSQTEQIIVGVTRIIIDSLFYFKDLYRENSSLSIAKADICYFQKILHGHACFRRSTGSIVDRTERYLCTGSGIHRIQVVDQRFHCLIGCLICFFHRNTDRCLMASAYYLFLRLHSTPLVSAFHEPLHQVIFAAVNVRHMYFLRHGIFQSLTEFISKYTFLMIFQPEKPLYRIIILFTERARHSFCHRIIKVRYGLSAVHLVLICLNCNTCQ